VGGQFPRNLKAEIHTPKGDYEHPRLFNIGVPCGYAAVTYDT